MKHTIEINVDEWQLFEMLCKELYMDFVLDTDRKFYIKNGRVCSMENGAEKVYDDRANLFVALRNVLVQMSPNSECRSEKHIFNYECE
jgi:hypothetical protein